MDDRSLTRRRFLGAAGRCGLAIGGAALLLPSPEQVVRMVLGLPGGLGPGVDPTRGRPGAAIAGDPLSAILREAPVARYWVSTSAAADRATCLACHDPEEVTTDVHEHRSVRIKCLLCARGCLLGEGERGQCRARIVSGGQLRSLVYGRPLTIHVDPIEKKPFYHFLPGREAYSLCTSGCPLRCRFCQNWEISQARPEDYERDFTPPEAIAGDAARRRVPVLAFTYNEPTVFTEYLLDIARAGHEQGLRSALVSCGFMTEAPLADMCKVLSAIKIDLKGFDEGFYRRVCEAELQPVLRSISQIARSGVHLELVNLVVPTLNDSSQQLEALVEWVAGELGPDVPVHFTRFHPDYKIMNLPPTPVSTLERARDLALEKGLHYPYVGNVPGHPGNHTYCPGCGEIVVQRQGFFVTSVKIEEGRCQMCGEPIAGVWS
jgi:pyruvate formate lyase activating enzyme